MKPPKLSITFKALESCRLYENTPTGARKQITTQNAVTMICCKVPGKDSLQRNLAALVRTGEFQMGADTLYCVRVKKSSKRRK